MVVDGAENAPEEGGSERGYPKRSALLGSGGGAAPRGGGAAPRGGAAAAGLTAESVLPAGYARAVEDFKALQGELQQR